MMEPLSSAVTICPVCRQKIRSTAEQCPNCGAERHFGPRLIESGICAFAGMVILAAISRLLMPMSLWTIIFAVVGLCAGFLFSHNRFGGDRWLGR
ncbi:hypothetical protein [Gluconobacter frateurii]|uniref:Zinc-ribbon domain-containing protein n=1 Tax=Gluconobacter frateurii NRIC 0228 TaxID=1307946 RepID=A0ABQ0Q7L9_9PROT|nr:hypothetical protein [Gluconobacter frateurii]OAG73121.1 hypothetical protein A0J51_01735 [Gluconobacter japonicus]GBR08029.1 hypothetical protein AA0228_0214 [Gluconobacter frateurii NRIC 0228]GLP91219.1 hypothetical protein GCM10007868_22940 [Gluconobacter frateurii]